MDLFGEKIGYKRYPDNTLIKRTINNDGKDISLAYNLNYNLGERININAQSELYARELIKRNGISDQNTIKKNNIYQRNYNRQDNYQYDKIQDLEIISRRLRNDFRDSYKKALQEGYSQSESEKISQIKTDKKKMILMQDHNNKFPF